MTKEKIIDLLYNEIGNPDYKTVGDYHKGIADTLLAKFEQEKKEVAKEILNDLKGLLEGYIHTNDNNTLYEYYCKKYGVELW